MSDSSKLTTVKTILGIASSDTTQDEMLSAYLDLAGEAILEWMYINYDEIPETVEVPSKYSSTQAMAVVAGVNLQGGENQWKHSENGIVREWHYTDMIEYVRAHVNQIPKVV